MSEIYLKKTLVRGISYCCELYMHKENGTLMAEITIFFSSFMFITLIFATMHKIFVKHIAC